MNKKDARKEKLRRQFGNRVSSMTAVPTGLVAVKSIRSTSSAIRGESSLSVHKKRKTSTYIQVQDTIDNLTFPAPSINIPADEGIYVAESTGLGEVEDTEIIPGAGLKVHMKKKRYLSWDHPLLVWLPHRDKYLQATLRNEGRGKHMATCAQCHSPSPAPTFRCLSCFGRRILCKSCITEAHVDEPLHILQSWNGSYWEHLDSRVLGIRVNLGHQRHAICSHPQRENKKFTVFHSNGVHEVHVVFCNCTPGFSMSDQLMDFGWWPASPTNPETAATEEVLRLFDSANGCGKISTYHWAQTLVEQTIPAGVVKVASVYEPFKLMQRQFRHIKMLKRAGRGHSPGGAEATKPGELAIACRACPNKVTLPPNYKSLPPQEGWIHSVFTCEDGNWRLQGRLRSDEIKDPALGAGSAYVLDHKAYLQALGVRTSAEECDNHCSGFDAISMANTKRNRGLRATGVGVVACARHEMVRPQGLGDLQVGERYANMDYIFFSSLVNIDAYYVVVSYDIACQWSKKLWSRMSQLPTSLHLPVDPSSVFFFVPKFHLAGHNPDCQLSFSFNFRRFVGRTDGEGSERIWSALNRVSSATKEMGPGGRHDMIDSCIARQNWSKVRGLGRLLATRLVEALSNVTVHFQAYHGFTQSLQLQNSGAVEAWEAMTQAWEADNSLPNPFEFKTVELTQAMLRSQIADEEKVTTRLSGFDTSYDKREAYEFLVTMIGLEKNCLSIQLDASKKCITPTESISLQQRRSTLAQRMNKLADAQELFIPGLKGWLPLHDTSTPVTERRKLWLPSSLPQDVWSVLCVEGLPELEARIRYVDALDKLQSLRSHLRTRTVAQRFKSRNMVGLAANTRASELLQGIERRIKMSTCLYQQAYTALLALRGPGDWQETIRPLRKEDVVGLNEHLLVGEERAEYITTLEKAGRLDQLLNEPTKPGPVVKPGEGKRILSWIWYSISEDELRRDISGDLSDGVRVEWAKTRARYYRWKEEIILLEEEMRRSLAYGAWKASWWEEQASPHSEIKSELSEGLHAYGHEQAAFERTLTKSFRDLWCQLRERASIILQDLNRIENSPNQDGGVMAELCEIEVEIPEADDDEDGYDYEDDVV